MGAASVFAPTAWAVLTLLPTLLLPQAAEAAISTFQISTPQQCAPLTLNWTSPTASTGAEVGYQLVLIPTSDQDEVLSNISFTATGLSHTINELPLSSGTEFIALLQDDTDGADGGRVSQIVSVAVGDGGGTDCLADLPHYLDFTFYVDPTPPDVCESLTIGWADNATSPVGITGMIPGGESFDIPITDESSLTASWITRIPVGTNFLLAMSDGGARGSGGSSPIYTVGGSNTSCLSGSGLGDAVVYSSLPVGDVPTTLTVTVTAPGGATTITQLPGGTASSGASSGGGGSSGTNVGAIVGGVVGGVAALAILALLLWFFLRRKKRAGEAENPEMTTANRPWDPPVPRDPDALPPSLYAAAGAGAGAAAGYGAASSTGRPSTDNGSHPPSAFSHVPPSGYGYGSDTNSSASMMDEGRRSTEKRALASSSGGQQQGPPRLPPLAPPGALGAHDRSDSGGSGARFVRHEDAGLVERGDGGHGGAAEEEVVDLPPLYADARRAAPAA